jgi:hypothetical protein
MPDSEVKTDYRFHDRGLSASGHNAIPQNGPVSTCRCDRAHHQPPPPRFRAKDCLVTRIILT